ncbi:MAG: hypothetical protein QHI48_10080, partial [Bacteroidota bacterium]|nr:hypothetical protein [Bacteroidota bacterium]
YREVIRRALCIHCNRPTPMNAHLHSFDEQRHEKAFAAAGLVAAKTLVLQNVLFLRSRLSWLCRKLPFPLWRILDRSFSLLYRKNATIVVTGALPERAGEVHPA